MRAVFEAVWYMSVSAGWLILAVVIVRMLFQKASRQVLCFVWIFVGLRLCVPFSIESPIGLIPKPQTYPVIEMPAAVNGTIVSIGWDVLSVFLWVWIIGVVCLVCYAVISFLLLRRRVTEAAHLKEEIWVCDGLDTPFLFGIFQPRIYLPAFVDERHASYVIAHERAHQQRRDPIWKLLGYALLAIHWFNPLVWLAYALFCRDMEMACDEQAVRFMNVRERKAYSHTLLLCSVSGMRLAACPIAFGEGQVKDRIRSVLSYKKPTVLGSVMTVLMMVLTVICFITSPISSARLPSQETIRYGGWTVKQDFYGDGSNCLCAYRFCKNGSGESFTDVILEEDGMYYAGTYRGTVDARSLSFDRQLLQCSGIYSFVSEDKKGLCVSNEDGQVIYP